jgi:murein DD-endopeptidase MepM/ murein hydrolase activator NlpD
VFTTNRSKLSSPLRVSHCLILIYALLATGVSLAQTARITITAPLATIAASRIPVPAVSYVTTSSLRPKGSPVNRQARIAIAFDVVNTGVAALDVERVELMGRTLASYSNRVIAVGETASFLASARMADGGMRAAVFDLPLPSNPVALKVYFRGVADPVERRIRLVRRESTAGQMDFPGRADDADTNEVWGTGPHGIACHLGTERGCDQAFAIDTVVRGWDTRTKQWSESYPGVDGTKPWHSRSYGRPLYAVRGGTVCFALSDHAEWTYPPKEGDPQPISPSLGRFSGGGNVMIIKSGRELDIYAHLQPNSIPNELRKAGAPIKRGQYVGKLGFSGASSGPHLHFDSKPVPSGGAPLTGRDADNCDPRAFGPFSFSNAQTLPYTDSLDTSLARTAFETGTAVDVAKFNNSWSQLTNDAIPESGALVHPSAARYDFCSRCESNAQYYGVWRSGENTQLTVRRPDWDTFFAKWKLLSEDSFRLTRLRTVVENGKRAYIGVFDRGTGKHYLWNITGWQAFTAKIDELGRSGLYLADFTRFDTPAGEQFIGVFNEYAGRSAFWSINSWAQFTTKWNEMGQQGLRLVAIDASTKPDGSVQYIGVFREGQGQILWRADGWNAFIAKWQEFSANGFRLAALKPLFADGTQYFIQEQMVTYCSR